MTTSEEVFAALRAADVRFVVVGGVAVVLHGHPRLTVDLDIVVDLAQEPATRAMRALAALGLEPRVPVDPVAFADAPTRRSWIEEKGMRVFMLYDPSDDLFELDVFVEEPLPFEDLVKDAKVIAIDGEPVRVASIDHLIAMKRAAGRPKDLLDIEELERLRDG